MSEPTGLNAMLYILVSLDPRLNWYNFSAFGTLHTRITVPLTEAVASRVPFCEIWTMDRGDLCADGIIFAVVRDVVENKVTSPLD